jgi:hypothetical protein
MTRWLRISPLALIALLVWAGRPQASPSAPIFDYAPGNPMAGAEVRFFENEPGNERVLWSFGDGVQSSRRSPTHRYGAHGDYVVTLTRGTTTHQRVIHVSLPDVLRVNPVYPFDVSVEVVHPHDGSLSTGRAMPQSPSFGYFSFPAVTGIHWNPEVFVKMLESPNPGEYWFYWNGLTTLDFTLTVRDVETGATRTYHKPLGSACGGFDTFVVSPDSIPPTPTPPPVGPPGGGEETPAGPTMTPTRTPTPTATPIPVVEVRLSARTWQWNIWAPELGANGESSVTLFRGRPYRVIVENGDIESSQFRDHSFSGIADLGLSGGPLPNGGEPLPPQLITPTENGDYVFLCTDPLCGTGHGQMLGIISVADPPPAP